MRKIAGTLLLFLCSLPFCGRAQGVVDHLNNDVFYVVNSKCSFNFTPNLVGITGAFFYDTSANIFSDANEPHVAHANAFVLNVSLSDFNYDLNDFFTQSNQPTLSINFGHSFNSVTNFNNWDQLNKAKRGFLGAVDHDLYIGLFVSKGFFNYWDTVNHQVTDQSIANYNANSFQNFSKFLNYGLKVDYNLYYVRWLAVAMTGTIQNGYNNQLVSFQGAPGSAYPGSNGVYTMNDLAGRLGGDISHRSFNMRLSIGTPIFVRSIFRNVQHTEHRKTVLENGKHNSGRTVDRFLSSLFVMPYYAPNGWTNTRWTHEFGSSINFLQSPYGGSNSKIGASEGVGVDWQSGVNTKNGWSGPIVYITGKLNIGPSPNSGRQKMVRRESKDEDPAPEVHTLEPDTKGAN